MSKPPNTLTGNKNPSTFPNISAGVHPYGQYTPHGVFSDEVHNNLIVSKGALATHWRHALNPNRKAVEGGVDLSAPADLNGYNLYDPRELYIVQQNLSWENQLMIQGLHGAHTTTINYTGHYTDAENTRVFLRPGDVIMMNNSQTVLTQQLCEYKPTARQRLNFPIVSVDYLANAGNERFEEGSDFMLVDGTIEWTSTGRRPKIDPKTGTGEVLSVVYWTNPYYVVVSTPRAFRTAFSNPTGNAGLVAEQKYLPGSGILKMLWLSDSVNITLPNWPKQE